MKPKQTLWLIFVIIALASLPYGVAALSSGSEQLFGGFLFNPMDGNSYLAKMHQGLSGSWSFTLPYSVEQGQGRALFLYYLALGHLARLTNLPLVVVFHLARVVGGVGLGLSLSRFYRAVLPDEEVRSQALILGLVGSGLGWLAVPFGGFLADLWVAEGYPFLSLYSNAHFPLALAILLEVLILSEGSGGWKRYALLMGLGLALGILLPFAVVIAGMILGGSLVWLFFQERSIRSGPLLAFMFGGAPMLAYQFWLVQTDPQLAVWNSQNLTPSPPAWNLLLALSPAVLLAGAAIIQGLRRRSLPDARLWTWAAAGLLLAYFPFALQRRFLLGLFIPLAGLAPLGARWIGERWPLLKGRIWSLTLVLSLPTTILVLATGLFGSISKDPEVFLTNAEMQALNWIEQETPLDSRILASPQMGLYVPAYTGRRVYYGHPFETPHADQERAWVIAAYRDMDSSQGLVSLRDRRVDYVIWGPRERAIQTQGSSPPQLPLVFEFEDVQIYGMAP